MSEIDYAAAATRHLRDSQYLAEGMRCDNAFYLAGYVVECSLKAVVAHHDVAADAYGHRLLKLESEGLDLAVSMVPAAARYRPPGESIRAVRDTWSTSFRYSPACISASQASGLMRHAASVWKACVGEMLLDGLILELP